MKQSIIRSLYSTFLRRVSVLGMFCASLTFGTMPVYAEKVENPNSKGVFVYRQTCERMVAPLGIDPKAPTFGWQLNGGMPGEKQVAYRLRVATSDRLLLQGKADVWESGRVEVSATDLQGSNLPGMAQMPAHIKLASATTYYWQVMVETSLSGASQWSPIASFTTGLEDESAWTKAQWLALEPVDTLIIPGIHNPLIKKTLGARKVGMYQLPRFRKVIDLKQKPVQALWFVCGLGQQECYINGDKVGDNVMDPAWTQFDKEVRYVSHDVTEMLQQGKNVLSVMLGNGFYNNPRERYNKLIGTYGAPKVRAKLVVKYPNGKEQTFVTDETWRTSSGAVTYSSIYGGENFDATLDDAAWKSRPDYNDKQWKKPIVLAHEPKVKMLSGAGSQVGVHQELPPVVVKKNAAGHYVYDFGQNMSGIVRIQARGAKGQIVVLRPAELLRDGAIYQKPVGSPYYWQYTMGSSDEETWQPQFTYTGFRYVEVEGAVPEGVENPEGLPVVTELTALHITHRTDEVGTFYCSNPMLNRVHEIIDWAMRSNTVSLFTDCPHREKLGWLEQVHLMQQSLLYRRALAPLYTKVFDDMATAQTPEGVIPTIAPEYTRFTHGFEDTPEWGSAFIIAPWQHYKWHGDKAPIVKHYDAMSRYIDYLSSRADNHIVSYGLGDWYDLGPELPGYAQLTTNGVTATAIYYYDVVLMSKMARLLQKESDAERFETLAQQIKQSYNATYLNRDSCYYDRNSQCANAISLFMGLVPEECRQGVSERLIADIAQRDNAFTAGDVGYGYLLFALSQMHRDDVVYDMNVRYDIPGYGWQLAHGATSLTESWQAYERVSNNHFMLGHLMEWLYGSLGGLRQYLSAPAADLADVQTVAWARAVVDPRPVGDVTSCRTSLETPMGRYAVEWKLRPNNVFLLQVQVPVGGEAEVCLPTTDISKVTQYGAPIVGDASIQDLGVKSDGRLHVVVGSGIYSFEISSYKL